MSEKINEILQFLSNIEEGDNNSNVWDEIKTNISKITQNVLDLKQILKFKKMWETNKKVWFLNKLGYFQGFRIFTLLSKLEDNPDYDPFKIKGLIDIEISMEDINDDDDNFKKIEK